MNEPAWLAEFHRRWQAARGRRTDAATRPFGMAWPELLEGAGLTSAEDERTAQREAERLEAAGKIALKRHRSRKYLIQRIALRLEAETWLRERFGAANPVDLKEQSLATVRLASALHPLWPDEWRRLCDGLAEAFTAEKPARPFAWHRPERTRFLLGILRGLTSREWVTGTPIRTASVELGLDSKALERHRRGLESGLARMFGGGTSFDDLGLVTRDSEARAHGPLELVFGDGPSHQTHSLDAPYTLDHDDLRRAKEIRTTASRLLTVENAKTTFRQLAAVNRDGDTLIVATSFPTSATKELLAKLPAELPHFHFGDTDPAGWLILQKLREDSPRPVASFRMNWRPAANPKPLTARDRALIGKLLDSSEMADCHDVIAAMLAAGDRGDFEQESLGPPDLAGWPFFSGV